MTMRPLLKFNSPNGHCLAKLANLKAAYALHLAHHNFAHVLGASAVSPARADWHNGAVACGRNN
jgi:hypothetical protein